MLFPYKDEDMNRFSNLHYCTFKRGNFGININAFSFRPKMNLYKIHILLWNSLPANKTQSAQSSNINMLKGNSINNGKMCELCSKLKMKTPGQYQLTYFC